MGEKATDSITGYSGMVIARIEYLNGCVQYELQAQGMHDSKPIKAQWFDEQRLSSESNVDVGGPGDVPPRPSRP